MIASVVSLAQAVDERVYGGKSVQLGAAIRAGLPVPPGFAVSAPTVERVYARDAQALEALEIAYGQLGPPAAARSSAVGEDSAVASFAGQHATVLNVDNIDALIEAVRVVRDSAHSAAARGYRARLGIASEPAIGVVLQRLVHSERAGVLFTRNPLTGADERVIEATWGLGEAVVAGLVTPDNYRVARDGKLLARTVGNKDLAIMPSREGGTCEVEVEAHKVHVPCLDEVHLAKLNELASACERHFGGGQDIEWAFVGATLYLLQRRAITTRHARGAE